MNEKTGSLTAPKYDLSITVDGVTPDEAIRILEMVKSIHGLAGMGVHYYKHEEI